MRDGGGINPQGDWEACRPESGGTCQYRPAYALRATAGTRDSGPSAADQAPAQHHLPSGAHNRNVKITAYAYPVPPPELTDFSPLTVHFEVTDPDDRSPYDGKTEPSDPTNHWPNDNRDPQRRMWWDEAGNPAGYSELQQSPYLSFRSRSATHVLINGIERYAAETKLLPTGRYAGDNYQVRATLREPDYENEGGRFDTHTGMNTNNVPYVFHASTIAETTPLVAWKRVYIEHAGLRIVGHGPSPGAAPFVERCAQSRKRPRFVGPSGPGGGHRADFFGCAATTNSGDDYGDDYGLRGVCLQSSPVVVAVVVYRKHPVRS